MFGGKLMDSFVDKLAQRFTAQEMIKANSAAEAEELNMLKGQVEKYNDCLKQMEQLTQEMAAIEQRMGGAVDSSVALQALVESSMSQVNQAISNSGTQVTQVAESGMSRLKELADKSMAKLESFQQESMAPEVIKEIVEARIDKTDENLHKECVKVYRNMQAVVNEESTKISEKMQAGFNGQGGKLNGILSIAIMALVMSFAGVVLQVLGILGVF